MGGVDDEHRCLARREDITGAACTSPECGQGGSAGRGIAGRKINAIKNPKRNKPQNPLFQEDWLQYITLDGVCRLLFGFVLFFFFFPLGSLSVCLSG